MSLHKNVADDILIHCDRTKSKEARVALEKLFWQPLRTSGIVLNPSCVLSPENDILLGQETQKHHLSDGLWKCLLCDKKFRTEHYLDKHLARKHPLVRHDHGRVCLADLCGSLIPCVPLTRDVLPYVSSFSLNDSLGYSSMSEHEAKTKDFCEDQSLKQRRIFACSEVLYRCMRPPRHKFLSWSAQEHFRRFKHELCERAVQIECVDRKNVWQTVGEPKDLLRSSYWMPVRQKLGWTALMVALLILILIYIGRRNARKRRPTRRSARRPKVS